MNVQIRQATEADWVGVHDVVIEAFGVEEGSEIAALVSDLLAAEDALPYLSLVAVENNTIVGHILFTKVQVGNPPQEIASSILAPLSVRPEHQGQGIGGRLISEGINQLRARGIELVFVLGHPEYYPKHGFSPAGSKGFDAPHPIPPANADAWMAQELRPGVIGNACGQVICAGALNDPKLWRE